MTVLTGATAELRHRGARVAKCKDFSLDISRDALETTCLGEWDRTYINGLRGATGSATVLYDPQDTAARALLNGIFENGGTEAVQMLFGTVEGARPTVDALLTRVSAPVATGQVIACSVEFQITGKVEGSF